MTKAGRFFHTKRGSTQAHTWNLLPYSSLCFLSRKKDERESWKGLHGARWFNRSTPTLDVITPTPIKPRIIFLPLSLTLSLSLFHVHTITQTYTHTRAQSLIFSFLFLIPSPVQLTSHAPSFFPFHLSDLCSILSEWVNPWPTGSGAEFSQRTAMNRDRRHARKGFCATGRTH